MSEFDIHPQELVVELEMRDFGGFSLACVVDRKHRYLDGPAEQREFKSIFTPEQREAGRESEPAHFVQG